MRLRTLVLRVLAAFALDPWIGGFTFYGTVVVPILHEEMDSLQAGGIARRVTGALNLVGLAVLTFAWLAARPTALRTAFDGPCSDSWPRPRSAWSPWRFFTPSWIPNSTQGDSEVSTPGTESS